MIRAGRERALAITLGSFVVLLLLLAIDARARIARQSLRSSTAVARVTGLSDLAIASSSRWLRHPSLAEPYAAVWDAPLGLDVDPAGATIPQPVRRAVR